MAARGLIAGSCYREVGALSCEKDCIIDFFPTTQAQISLVVRELSRRNREKFGRLFEIDFRYFHDGAANVLKLSTVDYEQLEQKLANSDGYFRSIPCPQ